MFKKFPMLSQNKEVTKNLTDEQIAELERQITQINELDAKILEEFKDNRVLLKAYKGFRAASNLLIKLVIKIKSKS